MIIQFQAEEALFLAKAWPGGPVARIRFPGVSLPAASRDWSFFDDPYFTPDMLSFMCIVIAS